MFLCVCVLLDVVLVLTPDLGLEACGLGLRLVYMYATGQRGLDNICACYSEK